MIAPPPSGTDLEGAPGRGDSGGPALITIAGKAYVAGVSSAGYDGVDGPGSYGAVDVFTRVSTHAAWIDSVMKPAQKHPPQRTRGVVNSPRTTLRVDKASIARFAELPSAADRR
ncbi:MAG TPA: trypsin-like serine protease [Gemmatimonadaceae bacterium]|nr:trypsin-like serine protease [Gemmatimonadaceae bacterium]